MDQQLVARTRGDAATLLSRDDMDRFDGTTLPWLVDLFNGMDHSDPHALTGTMHDDVVFRWGSVPDIRGKDQVHAMFEDFFTKVTKMRHRILQTYDLGETVCLQGEVAFELVSGEQLYCDFADVFTLRDGKVAMQIVYIDNTALTEALAG